MTSRTYHLCNETGDFVVVASCNLMTYDAVESYKWSLTLQKNPLSTLKTDAVTSLETLETISGKTSV
jgi:hypothetical protein